MGYLAKEAIDGYYFRNDSIIGLLEDIKEFMSNGRSDLFQIKTEQVVIEWDDDVSQYVASVYVRVI